MMTGFWYIAGAIPTLIIIGAYSGNGGERSERSAVEETTEWITVVWCGVQQHFNQSEGSELGH